MKKLLFWLLIMTAGWAVYQRTGQVQLGPGVMAPAEPQQQMLQTPITQQVDAYQLTELASFKITAKVLAKKNYSFDRGAQLSPTDLALGWGRMSDENVLEQIKISQSGRFYFWRVAAFPIPQREIETHSANMHVIPENISVKHALGKVRPGDIIEMSGSLVNVLSTDNQWRWRSSLTREDTGGGACELIWVKSLRIVTPKT
ncbi:MAG: hypothetical protein GX673_05050 [Gammaproteobacteria bacterium]|nr:hypothetical protein [Gammaproteobacteria bacterium]